MKANSKSSRFSAVIARWLSSPCSRCIFRFLRWRLRFLEYDPGDIFVLVAGLLLGPWWGLGITLVASLVQGVTVSAASGLYGILMHIISTGTLVLVATFVKRLFKSRLSSELSVACACWPPTAVMLGANMVITPAFMGVSVEAVRDMLLPVFCRSPHQARRQRHSCLRALSCRPRAAFPPALKRKVCKAY